MPERTVKVWNKGGTELAVFTITLGGPAHSPIDMEYFDEARRLAVENMLVSADEVHTLKLLFVVPEDRD